MSAATPSDISFEQAMERLEEIVGTMESDRMPLDEMVGSYEEGMKLLQVCRQRIEQARQRIEIINIKGDGKAETAPFEIGREDSAEEKPRSSAPAARRRPAPAPAPRPEASGEDDEIRLF
ncbi:MAG: exodeoxyribonuclease VII small subunit [Verrucomicrobiota bacterium]